MPHSPPAPSGGAASSPPGWTALDAAHVWHPYTQHGLRADPLPIARGEGAYLYDAAGNRLFDAISSWWVNLHGHAHPAIADAIAEQAHALEQVIFAGYTHEPAARLAAELADVLPAGLTRIFFSDDGSTAVEAALKMAVQLHALRGGDPRRPARIVALENAYHGDTFGAMSASARSVFTAPFEPLLFSVDRLPDPSEGDVLAALDSLLDRHRGEVAAVIVEPLLLASGGMRVWGEDVLRGIRARTGAAGVPLIADEVATGFGRTGPLFACARAGIEPDILCMSKGITGGFLPLGATAAREEIFQAFFSTDRRRTFFHGHSYTGNPLACAAARASLRLLDDDCAARRRAIEGAHRAGLARLASHPRVRNPRLLGTVAAFGLVADGEGYLSPIGAELAAFARSEGVLLRPLGDVVYLMPPYCATPAEIEGVFTVIERFLEMRTR